MRYREVCDLGGFLWWLLIRFTKTKLSDEQTEEKWARNIAFLLLCVLIIGFISVKVEELF